MVNLAFPLPPTGNFFPPRQGNLPRFLYGRARKRRFFQLFSKKSHLPLKAFFAPPLSPFEAASSLMAAT